VTQVPPDAWSRFENKFDRMSDTLSGLDTRTARIEEKVEAFKAFQAKSEVAVDAVETQVDDLERRMTALEALEVKKFEERLKKTEQFQSRIVGVVTGASAVLTLLSGLVLWYLSSVIEKLPTG